MLCSRVVRFELTIYVARSSRAGLEFPAHRYALPQPLSILMDQP